MPDTVVNILCENDHYKPLVFLFPGGFVLFVMNSWFFT